MTSTNGEYRPPIEDLPIFDNLVFSYWDGFLTLRDFYNYVYGLLFSLFVTITTTQTVSGSKTFISSIFNTLTTTSITVNNYNFAIPAQSVNNYSTIVYPYNSINNWSLTTISGTAPVIIIGNSFTGYVNNFATQFPEYPLFNQYLTLLNGLQQSIFSITQNITISKGQYLLTFYTFGRPTSYSTKQTISVTLGDGSVSNFTSVDGGWSKLAMKFKIATSGSNLLTILISILKLLLILFNCRK